MHIYSYMNMYICDYTEIKASNSFPGKFHPNEAYVKADCFSNTVIFQKTLTAMHNNRGW